MFGNSPPPISKSLPPHIPESPPPPLPSSPLLSPPLSSSPLLSSGRFQSPPTIIGNDPPTGAAPPGGKVAGSWNNAPVPSSPPPPQTPLGPGRRWRSRRARPRKPSISLGRSLEFLSLTPHRPPRSPAGPPGPVSSPTESPGKGSRRRARLDEFESRSRSCSRGDRGAGARIYVPIGKSAGNHAPPPPSPQTCRSVQVWSKMGGLWEMRWERYGM